MFETDIGLRPATRPWPSTHPHHKHTPPNIKRNRLPAPQMSFSAPNLPALIREIEALISDYPSTTLTSASVSP